MWDEAVLYIMLRLIQVGLVILTIGAMYEVYKLL
jgi:hypothetical protein